MKFFFDLFPIVVFFVAYKTAGIFVATAVAIGATVLQIAWVWLRRRQVDTMLWVNLAIIGVFGGATLLLHDKTFIQWKPTVLYWLFAAALAGSQIFAGKNLMQKFFGAQIELPAQAWRAMNWSWAGFFVFMGVANLFVAYNFSEDAWVNFKLFGGTGLLLCFALLQAFFIARYLKEED